MGLGGLYMTTPVILRDFPPALNPNLFGTTYYVLTKHGIRKCPNKDFLALYLVPCPGPAVSKVCHSVTVERRKNPKGWTGCNVDLINKPSMGWHTHIKACTLTLIDTEAQRCTKTHSRNCRLMIVTQALLTRQHTLVQKNIKPHIPGFNAMVWKYVSVNEMQTGSEAAEGERERKRMWLGFELLN